MKSFYLLLVFSISAFSVPCHAMQASNIYELSGHARAAVAMIERDPHTAVREYERIGISPKTNPFAAYRYANALAWVGRQAEGEAILAGLTENPQVRGSALVLLSMIEASTGQVDASLKTLQRASDLHVSAEPSHFLGSASFEAIAQNADFIRIANSFETFDSRIARGLRTGDISGLRNTLYSKAHLWLPSSNAIVFDLVLLAEAELDKEAELRDKDVESTLVAIAREADVVHGSDAISRLITRMLQWTPEEYARRNVLTGKLSALFSSIPSHRFDNALKESGPIIDELDRLGDSLDVLIGLHLQGLAYSGVISYNEPRKGVSKREENDNGIRCNERARDLAIGLGYLDYAVDAMYNVALHKASHGGYSRADVEQELGNAVILASERLVYDPGYIQNANWNQPLELLK